MHVILCIYSFVFAALTANAEAHSSTLANQSPPQDPPPPGAFPSPDALRAPIAVRRGRSPAPGLLLSASALSWKLLLGSSGYRAALFQLVARARNPPVEAVPQPEVYSGASCALAARCASPRCYFGSAAAVHLSGVL